MSRDPRHVSFRIGVVASRMESRASYLLEQQGGDTQKAAEAMGCRIGYLFAAEIVAASRDAEATIDALRARGRTMEITQTTILENAREAASWAIHDAGLPSIDNPQHNYQCRLLLRKAVDDALLALIGKPTNAG